MWTPQEITSFPVQLDETVHGSVSVTSIAFDGVIICNAAEYIDWTTPGIQLELDLECLIPRSWDMRSVIIRRAAERICILPDIAAALIDGDSTVPHLPPPPWTPASGAISLSHTQWEEFRVHCPKAPAASAIAPISTLELLWLFRLQAPKAFLPDPFDLKSARWDHILTTNGADPVSDIRHLQATLAASAEGFTHEFHTPPADAYTISIFIEDLSIIEWPVFSSDLPPAAYISEGIHFRLLEQGASG